MRLFVLSLALSLAALTSCAHAPSAAEAQRVAAPSTPAGERLGWFLQRMNEDQGRITAADAEAAFVEEFLEQVPSSQLVPMFQQIAGQVGTLSLESVTEQSPLSLEARLTSNEGRLQVSVAVEPHEPHRFIGLLIVPAKAERARPTSWSAIDSELASIAARTNLLAAGIDEAGLCSAVYERGAADELAIGSTFKLWVLLAASDAVSRGSLEWETPIAVRDEWKSLPSGVLQDETAGTTLRLERIARGMISISDNTATDHLLFTVGRDAVEASMAKTGAVSTARNRPFLSTRELFLLKFDDDADRAAWLSADDGAKRARLAALASAPLPGPSELSSWNAPRHIETLEWFASPSDLCRTMAALMDAGLSGSSPVLDILGANPGIQVDRQLWSYVGFKGGSEPGVLNLTFLLREASGGRWYFFSVGANDPEKQIDKAAIVSIAEDAIDLLGRAARADGVQASLIQP